MTNVSWEGFTHAEIYQRVQAGPGRGASTAVESAWADTEAVIRGIEERLAVAIKQAGGGWEGAAAEATRGGLTPLGQWAVDAAGDARLTATGVTAQGEQAAWLRNAMPSPSAPLWDEPGGRPVSDPLYLLDDPQTLQRKATNDAEQAVHLMNTYTSNSYENIQLMNYWTLPPTATVEAVGSTPGGGPVAGSAAGGGGPGSVPIGVVPPVAAPGTGPSAAGGRPGGTGGSGAGGPGTGVPPPSPTPAGRPPGLPPSRPVPPGPPDAGGVITRGPSGGSTGPGLRPVVPGPPARPTPGPSWRDMIPSPREPATTPRPAPEPVPPGGRPAPPAAGAGAEATRAPAATPLPAGGSRPGTPSFYPPMLGYGATAPDGVHRRPDYLLDDSGAFDDDRWFPPPVIGPDDVPPPRSRRPA